MQSKDQVGQRHCHQRHDKSQSAIGQIGATEQANRFDRREIRRMRQQADRAASTISAATSVVRGYQRAAASFDIGTLRNR